MFLFLFKMAQLGRGRGWLVKIIGSKRKIRKGLREDMEVTVAEN